MIIFKGNDKFAYRDPACFLFEDTYFLFFTVSEKDDGYMYNRIGMSKSKDLVNWTEPKIITERNLNFNFCSPGNILKKDGKYIMCFTSYPMPFKYSVRDHADETARLFTMSTSDFESFSEPLMLYPKGNTKNKDMGRMIDPYILEKNNKYYLFFKQNGVSVSVSDDLVTWDYLGNTEGGENACVIEYNGKYLLIHSPENGIGFKTSDDLETWEDAGFTTLLQNEWQWAKSRITAGFAMKTGDNCRYKYALFFHGSDNRCPETHGNASLGIAFTDDFKDFYYEI